MTKTFPGETAEYRAARNALLAEEIALRAQIEQVAKMRRTLPPGGAVKQPYSFTDLDGSAISMADLFTTAQGTLAIYSLMYRPDAATPCPMCVSMLDGLAGQARHVGQVIDFAVVSAATPVQLGDLAQNRDWSALRLLSAQGTSYQADYHGETEDGAQLPMMNIFTRTASGIHHFWGSESFFSEVDGQPRHVDLLWPLWNLLDLTPDGRGTDWYPALEYS